MGRRTSSDDCPAPAYLLISRCWCVLPSKTDLMLGHSTSPEHIQSIDLPVGDIDSSQSKFLSSVRKTFCWQAKFESRCPSQRRGSPVFKFSSSTSSTPRSCEKLSFTRSTFSSTVSMNSDVVFLVMANFLFVFSCWLLILLAMWPHFNQLKKTSRYSVLANPL